jgi:hypothetical protein
MSDYVCVQCGQEDEYLPPLEILEPVPKGRLLLCSWQCAANYAQARVEEEAGDE